mmetsp:Transcript_26578/g.56153  ORF Transcript_26578/g.56153 Transcript_26578/m.56153 type:complete len:156 (-) Transcript_26578:74-541(-)|eukprot:CAMPEP_0183728540 /NCGR_PEP_ID=MMETSP0737-20130205/28298_1 /TAXON_ID=385413 /ORGANISM="Thalassiosira miniscula, Strain CCMP1093" /LENGTH=155 /DNA_ID=CAMNT_0025960509 /DNA_START=36 /DNA_END=503 /DNA_ORIENTATION=+
MSEPKAPFLFDSDFTNANNSYDSSVEPDDDNTRKEVQMPKNFATCGLRRRSSFKGATAATSIGGTSLQNFDATAMETTSPASFCPKTPYHFELHGIHPLALPSPPNRRARGSISASTLAKLTPLPFGTSSVPLIGKEAGYKYKKFRRRDFFARSA